MNRKTLRLAVFGLVAFILLFALAFVLTLARGRAYGLLHPSRTPVSGAPASPYQTVEFTTPDGLRLRGWYIPPRNQAVIVFVHGMGGNRSAFLEEADYLTALGYGALLFDLRNHGESEGELTSLGALETRDVSAAVAFARQTAGPDSAVAVFGHSMGAAAVLLAAPTLDVQAVIAASAYTSMEDNLDFSVRALTGLPAFPFAPLVAFFGQIESGLDIRQVRPIDTIAQVSPRPLLLIHGALDATIPVENAYQLYEAARSPKQLYILPTAGHGGFSAADPDRYLQTLQDFLAAALQP